MPAVIVSFFLGILFYSVSYPHVFLLWISIFLLIFLTYKLNFLKLGIAFCFGAIWITIFVFWQNLWEIPTEFEGVPLTVIGHIASIPTHTSSRTHFLFEIDWFENSSLKFIHAGLAKLNWENAPKLTVGDQWKLHVKLKKPRSTLNPGGFDYEAWLFSHGIRSVGTVITYLSNIQMDEPLFSCRIDRLRQRLGENVINVLKNSPTSALIKALMVGDQNSISEKQWKVLRQTGTNHLFAIAGLHIGFVAHLAYGAFDFLARCSSFLMIFLSAPLLSAMGSLFFAMVYSALAGFSLPTQRAVIMLFVFLIAKVRKYNVSGYYSLSIAMGIILLMNPLQILTESFWLSFIAVGALIYGFHGHIQTQKTKFSKVTHGFKTQWITSVALIPLTLLLFQQASLVSFFANLIGIPWVGFLVAPLTLLSGLLMLVFPFLGEFLLKIADFLLSCFFPILESIGGLPNSQWFQVIFVPWVLISGSIAILLLLSPKGFPVRRLAGIWILPLIFCFYQSPKFGEVAFTLIDVGQGLSALIRTHSHVLVFDTGPRYKDFFDSGETILLPMMEFFHIRHIDTLVVSHGDMDHIGGSATLIKMLPIDRIITSVPERFGVPSVSVIACSAGQAWFWDGVRFEVLYPPVASFFKGNNGSCVLKLSTSTKSLLLTGDIEKEGEVVLLSSPEKLTADVLVAPHHGSKTSSTEAFIDAVHPKVALFPVGYRNQYHLPSPIIVKRYQEKGILTYDTVNCGAISIDLNYSSILPVHCYREEHKAFWRFSGG